MTLALCVLGTTVTSGCLDKPRVEDRWTRVDVLSSNLSPRQTLPPGTSQAVTLSASITYRSVLTGYAVAELRTSDSLAAAILAVAPDAPRVQMARDIDLILQHSRSLGRSTRAVTGWDHLIQPLAFSFTASTGAAVGPTGSRSLLFLLCYMGSGQRVQLPSGGDTIIVTPFISSDRQVLPVGMELLLSGTP